MLLKWPINLNFRRNAFAEAEPTANDASDFRRNAFAEAEPTANDASDFSMNAFAEG